MSSANELVSIMSSPTLRSFDLSRKLIEFWLPVTYGSDEVAFPSLVWVLKRLIPGFRGGAYFELFLPLFTPFIKIWSWELFCQFYATFFALFILNWAL